MAELERGYVQVYTGDGKGKTTAALGLCLRAAGHGLKSRLIQFMKGQINYGELEAVKKLDGLVVITQGGRASFVSKEDPDPEDVRLAQEALALAEKMVAAGETDLLVLDEINVALDFKLVPLEPVLDLIKKKPEKMELILTGRNAPPEIIEAADLVTEMRELKHYWKSGVNGRKGIER